MLPVFPQKNDLPVISFMVQCVSSLDLLSCMYSIMSLIIFFPVIFGLSLSIDETNQHIITDNSVYIYAACSLSACVPMVIDVALDLGYYWRKGYSIGIRPLILMSMIIYCAVFLAAAIGSEAKGYRYGDIITVVGYWQTFTMIFVIMWMLHTYDTRVCFTTVRVGVALTFFFFYCFFNLVADSTQDSAYNSFADVLGGLFFVVIIIVCISLVLKLRQSMRSFNSTAEWWSSLSFKDHCSHSLCVLGIVVIPLWITLPLFTYNNNTQFPDQRHTADYYKGIFIIRTAMVIFTTIIPGRIVRANQSEMELKAELKTNWIEYISHEMRTPMGIISMGLELTKSSVLEGTKDKTDIINTLRDLETPCMKVIDLLEQMRYLDALDKNQVTLTLRTMDPFQFFRIVLNPWVETFQQRKVNLMSVSTFAEDFFEVNNARINVDVDKLGMLFRKILEPLISRKKEGEEICIELEVISHATPPIKINKRNSLQSISAKVNAVVPFSFDSSLRVKIPLVGALSPLEVFLLRSDDFVFKRAASEGSYGIGIWIARCILQMHEGSMLTGFAMDGSSPVCCFDLPISSLKDHKKQSFRRSVANIYEQSRVDVEVGSPSAYTKVCLLPSQHQQLETSPDAPALIPATAHVTNICEGTAEAASQDAESWNAGNVNSNMHVLVVDDSALTRKIMVKVMLSLGHTCAEADDGSVAVEVMRKAIEDEIIFDVILLDNEMPKMKGRDAVRNIREMGYTGRVFGVTGNVLQADIDDFIENGVNLVILKPMSIDKFKTAIEETRN